MTPAQSYFIILCCISYFHSILSTKLYLILLLKYDFFIYTFSGFLCTFVQRKSRMPYIDYYPSKDVKYFCKKIASRVRKSRSKLTQLYDIFGAGLHSVPDDKNGRKLKCTLMANKNKYTYILQVINPVKCV